MNINKFIESLATGSGATHHLSHNVPTWGAFASIYGHEYTANSEKSIADEVRDYISSKAEILSDVDNYIGGWWEDGKLVLDISRHFDDLEAAIKFGRENKQRAVYSIDLDEVVYITEG
jgi:hypothetical protein